MNFDDVVAIVCALQDRVQVLEERVSHEGQINARLWREMADDEVVVEPTPTRRPSTAAAQQPAPQIGGA